MLAIKVCKRKRSNNTSSVLSKPKQKQFYYDTRFQKKINFSDDSESCFPAPTRRRAINRKRPLPSSITSDVFRNSMYGANPFPEATTVSKLHHRARVVSSRRHPFESRPGRTHLYSTRLHYKKSTVASPYSSDDEKSFVQAFWYRKQNSSDSIKPASSQASV